MALKDTLNKLKKLKNEFKELACTSYGIENAKFSEYPAKIKENMPQLKPVTVVRSGDNLVIQSSTANGPFGDTFKIYKEDNLILETPFRIIDLLFLDYGYYELTATANGIGFLESEKSESFEYSVYRVYSNLTNVTASIPQKAGIYSTISFTVIPEEGYYLPKNIHVLCGVSTAEYTYDNQTGEVIISNICEDLTITIMGYDTPMLNEPVISQSGDDIVWSPIENAENYIIYADGEPIGHTSETTFSLVDKVEQNVNHKICVMANSSYYQPSNFSNEVTIILNSFPIYGINQMYLYDELARTDDSVGMGYVVNTETGEIISDFDDCFPWNQMVVEEIGVNKFVKIPEMYFRVGVNEEKVLTDIAVSSRPRNTGKWYKVESFYYSCYKGSLYNEKMVSNPSYSLLSNCLLNDFRSKARNNGEGYFALDIYHRTVMLFLYMIEYAHKKPPSYLRGADDGISTLDSNAGLTTPSGYSLVDGSVTYHHINDFVGRRADILDGVVKDPAVNSKYLVSSDYTNYNTDGEGYTYLNLTPLLYADHIGGYGWDENHPFIVIPTKKPASTTDYYYGSSRGINKKSVIVVGYSHYFGVGYKSIYYYVEKSEGEKSPYVTSRLLYKPSNLGGET